MSYQVRMTGATVIIDLDGDFYQRQSDELAAMLAGLAAAGRRQVLINMQRVGLVASTTLTVLVDYNRTFATRGGRLALCGVAGSVAKVLKITCLTELFTVYATEEAALAAFTAPVPA